MKPHFIENGYSAQRVDQVYSRSVDKRLHVFRNFYQDLYSSGPHCEEHLKCYLDHQIQLSTNILGMFICKRRHSRQEDIWDELVRANIMANPKQTPVAPLQQGNYPSGNCAQTQ